VLARPDLPSGRQSLEQAKCKLCRITILDQGSVINIFFSRKDTPYFLYNVCWFLAWELLAPSPLNGSSIGFVYRLQGNPGGSDMLTFFGCHKTD